VRARKREADRGKRITHSGQVTKLLFGRIALGVLLIASACSDPAPAPARTRVVSAEQERMDALMRQNETRASEPALADAFDTMNAQYFGDRLPTVRIRWEEGLDAIGPLIAENFRLEGLTDGKVILLHPALEKNPRQLRAVLAHEMVHVELRDRPESHGPEFQSRLRTLAERGAFEGIVATERHAGWPASCTSCGSCSRASKRKHRRYRARRSRTGSGPSTGACGSTTRRWRRSIATSSATT
jgi:hypothetical protein